MLPVKRLYTRYIHNVIIAMEAILANKLKSLLTALGIMFGVAAVISMLAIGKGAQLEVLEQIKMVGVNNIIVTPSTEAVEGDNSSETDSDDEQSKGKRMSKGLSHLDAIAIKETIPSVKKVSPVISMNYYAVKSGKSYPVVLEGVSRDYFELLNLSLEGGAIFNENQSEKGLPVCVIGDNIRDKFFNQINIIERFCLVR